MSADPFDLDALITADLSARAAEHQLRSRRVVTPISPTRVTIDGREFVNFASNNYLGLTHHPRLTAAARTAVESDGVGSGAAGLITGHTARHASAETAIARWKGTENAVLLPSGYQANHAAVQTLAAIGERAGAGGARFLVDKLAHASLLDAVRATGAAFRVFPHNRLAKIERLLADAPAAQIQVVLTESIFSMDGDAADLPGLVELKRRRPFVLLLDEAHGSGVYGPNGAGYAAELGLSEHVDVSVVTLSKAIGCAGGAVCGSTAFCSALLNYGRAFIYSTSVPPLVAAVAEEAIHVMRDEPHRQQRVRALARRARNALGVPGLPSDSPIVPVVLGEAEAALTAARTLAEQGILAPAVRPPTVARGASRLRVTLSSEHTDDEVARLVDSLTKLRRTE
jgi:8-amino-7-oxononanoate synthase